MEDGEPSSHENSVAATRRRAAAFRRQSRVAVYAVLLLAGQSAATLLGRLYYDKGGNSKWMATLVQSAGFPVLLPLLCISFPPPGPPPAAPALAEPPSPSALAGLYLAFGLLLAADNMMYSYGLLYLPVSTYSLLCATQLAFNGVFSFFLNAQKFTPFVLNSLVLLTLSASLLAVHEDAAEGPPPGGKYAVGFLCTLGASAAYSLYLSLVQLAFEKVLKSETFSSFLGMQIYPSLVATCACVAGLFASGEWRGLREEAAEYEEGKASYAMTLAWTAVAWQVSSVGMLGLISEVSSLFSNVISALALPLVPVLAVAFFHDRMDGAKVTSMLLAIWGFLSYIYQHYLDDLQSKAEEKNESGGIPGVP